MPCNQQREREKEEEDEEEEEVKGTPSFHIVPDTRRQHSFQPPNRGGGLWKTTRSLLSLVND